MKQNRNKLRIMCGRVLMWLLNRPFEALLESRMKRCDDADRFGRLYVVGPLEFRKNALAYLSVMEERYGRTYQWSCLVPRYVRGIYYEKSNVWIQNQPQSRWVLAGKAFLMFEGEGCDLIDGIYRYLVWRAVMRRAWCFGVVPFKKTGARIGRWADQVVEKAFIRNRKAH